MSIKCLNFLMLHQTQLHFLAIVIFFFFPMCGEYIISTCFMPRLDYLFCYLLKQFILINRAKFFNSICINENTITSTVRGRRG